MDRRLAKDRGFTLIELMISVAVMAALAATVTLSVTRTSGDNRSDAVLFLDLHARLQQEAAISGQVAALAILPEGYQRLRWQSAWQPVGDLRAWKGEATVLRPGGTDQTIQIAPSGQSTRFLIRFSDGTHTRICESDGWGEVQCRGG